MRIISGAHKGRRFKLSKKIHVRPTTDLAKESLFNILSNKYHYPHTEVIDLFAGTGSIGYEFASRGCPAITSIDSNVHCIQFIKKTALTLNMPIQAIKIDAFRFLESQPEATDIIFADPPWEIGMEAFSRIPAVVFEKKLLKPEGVLILEHSSNTNLDTLPVLFPVEDTGVRYLVFFKKKQACKPDSVVPYHLSKAAVTNYL